MTSTVILKVERFRDEADEYEFRIPSEMEKLYVLKDIQKYNTLVALYYDGIHKFVLTTLLNVDEDGLWLDAGPKPEENAALLVSKKITFVSVQNNAKVQLEVTNKSIRATRYEGYDAFYIPMPEYILRIQRRGWFRINTPILNPLICTVPVPQTVTPEERAKMKPGEKKPPVMRDLVIRDIGWEGVGLVGEEEENELVKGSTFEDCTIVLPDEGTMTVKLQIMSSFKITTLNNIVKRHLGCMFHGLDSTMNAMLQRYICRLERETRIKKQ